MSNDSNRWKIFNSIARSKELTTTEKALLQLIFSYVNFEKGYAFPSVDKLMEEMPLKNRKIFFDTRKSLVNKGFLKIESTKGIGCKYYIIIPSYKIKPSYEMKPSYKTELTPSYEMKPTPSYEMKPQKENIKEKEKKNIYSDFEKIILKKYPGKKVKSVREKKVPKLLKEYSTYELTRCIERYAKECIGKDKQYILNESTFWNGRYMDYLDSNYSKEEVKEITTRRKSTNWD